MTRSIRLLALAAVTLTPSVAPAFVELSFEVGGTNLFAGDFVLGLGGFHQVNPFRLDVRLRGDQPISGISWNWLIQGDPVPEGLKYEAPPTVGPLFGEASYIGTAQPGVALCAAGGEAFKLASPVSIPAPYDTVIASYMIFRQPDEGFYPYLTLSATGRDVALQWSYTYRVPGTFPPVTTTEYGVPDVVPMRFWNIGPEPSTALLVLAGAATWARRHSRRRPNAADAIETA